MEDLKIAGKLQHDMKTSGVFKPTCGSSFKIYLCKTGRTFKTYLTIERVTLYHFHFSVEFGWYLQYEDKDH